MLPYYFESAHITSPSADKDLLICWASFNLSPDDLETATLSFPAKSTKFIEQTTTGSGDCLNLGIGRWNDGGGTELFSDDVVDSFEEVDSFDP